MSKFTDKIITECSQMYGEYIKEDEVPSTEPPVKSDFNWKQTAIQRGRTSIGFDNTKRPWELYYKRIKIGQLYDPSASVNNWVDKSEGWKIMFFAGGGNLMLKKQFPFEQLEDAKKFSGQIFLKIMTTNESPFSDYKSRIIAHSAGLEHFFKTL